MRIGPLFALVLILFSLGCISHRPAPPRWVNITDDRGDTVMVPVPVRRVVSLAPGETEILAAAGGPDLLVGRCTACTWPPEVLQVPDVGGSQTFSVGQVEALDPDLVLATPHVNGTRLETLRERGYAVLVFAPENMDGIFRNIRVVGEAIGQQRNAFIINEDLRKQETTFRAQTKDLPRVRAIYVILDDPLYVA
ncbi:MAG: helical backbone metal receptor, partial [Methanomicrobiales archaeon]|nr:helical backbone metal receptor [Methanomicrobiales archaeon]